MDFPCTWNALRVETFKVNLQIQRIFLMWAQTQASCEHLWATVIAGIACQHIALLRSQIHLLFVDIHHAMFSGCISTFFHWYVPCHLPFDSYVTDWIHRIYLWILMVMMVLTMVWTGNGSILSVPIGTICWWWISIWQLHDVKIKVPDPPMLCQHQSIYSIPNFVHD